jgi:hypothetical protein
MSASLYRSGPMKLCVSGPDDFIQQFQTQFLLPPFQERQSDPHTITVHLSVEMIAGKCVRPGSVVAKSRQDNSIVTHLGEEALLSAEMDWDNIFTNPLMQVLFQHGLYYFHSACLRGSDTLTLIAGASEAGKSTFGSLLASQGLTLLSDDLIFLSLAKDGIELIPIPKTLSVRNCDRKPFSKNIQPQHFSLSRLPADTKKHLLFPTYSNKATGLQNISVQSAIEKLEFLIPTESEDHFSLDQRKRFLAFTGNLLQTSRIQEIFYCDSQLSDFTQNLRERLGV